MMLVEESMSMQSVLGEGIGLDTRREGGGGGKEEIKAVSEDQKKKVMAVEERWGREGESGGEE